ncbi:MAG: HAD hydrolase-like protein [Lewinellaceae bacterium]|nr:HAD hydrolase-like protein [Lewinellaceae bacterium]
MIKLAVFDMAGTTVRDNDNVHHALMQAMEQFGVTVTRKDANDVMGYPKPIAIEALLERYQAPADLLEKIFPAFLDIMLNHYRNSPEVGAADHAEACFERLQDAGIKVALDTGFSRDITEAILDRLAWRDRIDAWVASDMVGRGRPYPDMIEYLMEATGIESTEQVVKIGDTLSDIQEGRNAEAALVISISSGAFTQEELAPGDPDFFAETLEEVTDLILRYNERISDFD